MTESQMQNVWPTRMQMLQPDKKRNLFTFYAPLKTPPPVKMKKKKDHARDLLQPKALHSP